MMIRMFKPADAEALAALFHASVYEAGIQYYTPEQAAAWSPSEPDPASYLHQAEGGHFFIAEGEDGQLLDGEDDGDLRLILAPGSSLGGARAKASVLDLQGQLSIAKFPQADDSYPVMQWEAGALDLARRADIEVATWRLEEAARAMNGTCLSTTSQTNTF